MVVVVGATIDLLAVLHTPGLSLSLSLSRDQLLDELITQHKMQFLSTNAAAAAFVVIPLMLFQPFTTQ